MTVHAHPGAAPVPAAALFISDLHLQAAHPRTAAAFLDFLSLHAAAARSLYLLGDIFEYWAGDDDLDEPFNRHIVNAIRAFGDAGAAVFWIAGNRDFLAGAGLAHAAGMTMLDEPHVAVIGGQRIMLVHGDAQCTDDLKYMEFRAMVRQPAWQAQFLALPLEQRKNIIAGLRSASREQQGDKSYEIMDVAPHAIAQVFASTATDTMIHGHTHRPALHIANGTRRFVLPDWELDAEPVRGGWITVDDAGVIARHGLNGGVIA